VLIAIESYYVLFAAMSGSADTVIRESILMTRSRRRPSPD
jgi:hypothetical protein